MNAAEFQKRLLLILAFHRTNPALEAAVMAEVNAFFAAHPTEPRTEFTAGLVASLVFERQQSAPQNENPQPRKKAA